MLKTVTKQKYKGVPSQTRLMAEFMLNTYKERIEKNANTGTI